MKKKMCLKTISIFLMLGIYSDLSISQSSNEEKPSRASKARLIFEERCKKSGEKIHKVISDVNEIYLMNIRPKKINFGNQYLLDDPYGRDFGGEAYIESFLNGFFKSSSKNLPKNAPPRIGYKYVDAIDEKDGIRYRYTGSIREKEFKRSNSIDGDGKTYKSMQFWSDRRVANEPRPRYGVLYEDISTIEDRDYWIAGSSLKVIDLETNEVIAERIGYMVDLAQGSTEGGRSPWLFAANSACPEFGRDYPGLRPGQSRANRASFQIYQTIDFVEKSLKPTK